MFFQFLFTTYIKQKEPTVHFLNEIYILKTDKPYLMFLNFLLLGNKIIDFIKQHLIIPIISIFLN